MPESESKSFALEMVGGCITDHGFHIPMSEAGDVEFAAPRGKGVCRMIIEGQEPYYISTRFTAYEELHPEGKIRNNYGHFMFEDADGDRLLANWESPTYPEEDGLLNFSGGTGKWLGARGVLKKILRNTPPLSNEEWIFFEGKGTISLPL